jgi:hypothetical protein
MLDPPTPTEKDVALYNKMNKIVDHLVAAFRIF